MAKFVPDVKTQRWIIVSPLRVQRPADVDKTKSPGVCPFCEGNEGATPPEIVRYGLGEKNKPGWKVRVIPNLYPFTDFHEVIIHSPSHDQNIENFKADQVILLLKMYRSRFAAHMANGQVIIFHNQGEHAGASLVHPHSQLVVIPKQINLDALTKEPVMNIIQESAGFVAYCPDFSQWPYEIWIAPKKEETIFSEISDDEINDLAVVFISVMKRLYGAYLDPVTQKIHGRLPFAYNYYIHHGKNWFIRIIPRFVHRAGFELGTGLSVNVADPLEAAEELRKIKV